MSQSNNPPKVCVILLCYNMAKYLSRCVESILRNTYHTIEIILERRFTGFHVTPYQ